MVGQCKLAFRVRFGVQRHSPAAISKSWRGYKYCMYLTSGTFSILTISSRWVAYLYYNIWFIMNNKTIGILTISSSSRSHQGWDVSLGASTRVMSPPSCYISTSICGLPSPICIVCLWATLAIWTYRFVWSIRPWATFFVTQVYRYLWTSISLEPLAICGLPLVDLSLFVDYP